MKKLMLAVALCFAAPLIPVGCTTPPSARVIEVQTLKAVGHTAESAVALSAHLYDEKKITANQANEVKDFYDNKFQPVYKTAVAAVQSNLDSFASAELTGLAAQLAQMVAVLQK